MTLLASIHFIFSFKYSQGCHHNLPSLKKLHFSLIKYRINFKIAMLVFTSIKMFISLKLVFKYLKHCATGYLQQLVAQKSSAAYDFHGTHNGNVFLLVQTSLLNYCKCESIFSLASVTVGNDLYTA